MKWEKIDRKWCGSTGPSYRANVGMVKYYINAHRRRCGMPGRREYHTWYEIQYFIPDPIAQDGIFIYGGEVKCKPTHPSLLAKAKQIAERHYANKGYQNENQVAANL